MKALPGNLFFSSAGANRIYQISSGGNVHVFARNSGGAGALEFGPKRRLYACLSSPARMSTFQPDGKETVLTRGVHCDSLAVTANGGVYFAASQRGEVG